jgi:uncharacterized membrane protein
MAIVLMALDHARDFFSPTFPNPEDDPGVSPALFFTRWVTHFCAPVFVLLAGVGASLYGRRRTKAQVSRFLLTRGLWLIALEILVVHVGWTFAPPIVAGMLLQVIWAIGVSMIALSALVWLPLWAIATVAFVMIFGHNLLDALPIESTITRGQPGAYDWSTRCYILLHVGGTGFSLPPLIWVQYPLIPWIGVLAAGYVLGPVFQWDAPKRHRMLYALGGASALVFVALRLARTYGDPRPWVTDEGLERSIMTFLNVEKYPPSLQFLLMTLGPALLLLPLLERARGPLATWLITFGRVPLFFYVLHLLLLNFLGWAYMEARFGNTRLIGRLFFGPPNDYQPNLTAAYLGWLAALIILTPPCLWYARLKARRNDWWLSYL